MAKDLEDVLHFFLPTAEADPVDSAAESALARDPEVGTVTGADDPVSSDPRPLALPILTLPVEARDVVRVAFAWNLAVELARLGARTTLVAPYDRDAEPLWPEAGAGPLGAEMAWAEVSEAAGLAHAAVDIAIRTAHDARDGGVVLACVPPAWLLREDPVRPLLRWLLLFCTPETRDLEEAYALLKRAVRRGTHPLAGLVVHGVQRMSDAERAFDRIAGVAANHLGHSPVSYGLLADDLHVYRAIASRRPIGLEHPQSRAARALRDVARMLYQDAQKMILV